MHQGHSVAIIYKDPGGKSTTLQRPVLMQAFEDARRGLFDVLAVWKYDRFSRVQDQASQALYLFKRYGVEVVSVTQPLPEGAIGTALRNMYNFASEVEHASIIARFYSGRRRRSEHGKLLGAPYPLYGYRHADMEKPGDNGRYVPDNGSIDGNPAHAASAVVRLIYQLAISGLSVRRIALRLEEMGMPTPHMVLQARGQLPRGRPVSPIWRLSTLSRVLSNPAYRGEYVAWRTEMQTLQVQDRMTGEMVEVVRKVPRAPDDENIIALPNATVPLVSRDEWLAAQVALQANLQNNPRNAIDQEGALLRYGFALCGYCGSKMQAQWYKTPQAYRYLCGTVHRVSEADKARCAGRGFSWHAPDVDGLVWDWVLANFERPELLRAKYAQWRAEREEGHALERDTLVATQDALQAADKRRRNYMRLAGTADDAEMAGEYEALAKQANEEVKSLRAKLDTLDATILAADEMNAAVDDIVQMGQSALDQLRTADYRSRRAVLTAFRVQVRLKRKTDPKEPLTISWILGNLPEVWCGRPVQSLFLTSG